MREGAKIQGAAAAAAGTAEGQSKILAREVIELKEAIGAEFHGYLRSWVGHLRDLVGFLKDKSDWLVKFGEAAIFVAGAIVTYGIITKIVGIASAVEGLALALTANPIALLLTGVVAGGAVGGMLANMGTGWVVSRLSYSPIFLIAGLMHPLSMVLIGKLLPDRYFLRRA
jgi:hypothetical protein